MFMSYLKEALHKLGLYIASTGSDPIPGLVLLLYMLMIYFFLAFLSGCSEFTFQLGGPTTPVHLHRAIPADTQTCRTDFHPWNEPCNNP